MKKAQILGGFLLAGLLATSASARDRDAVVGASGEIYVAQAGTYGQLFPDASPGEAGDHILALDIIKPDQALVRLPVPGTRNTSVVGKPALVYEDDSRTVLLVWVNKVDDIHSSLMTAAYNSTGWTQPIELTGRDHFSPTTEPQVAITRDSYRERGADGGVITRHRTFMHVLWEEEADFGAFATFYIPVILEEGVQLKANPLYNLNALIPPGPPATTFETPPELIRSPALHNGGEARAVVAAFTSAATRRVFTLEIEALPEDLGRLAEKTRSVIIDLGARLYPGNVRGLAEQTKAFILGQETEFQPEIIQAIADRAQQQVQSGNSQGLTSLAESTRSVIIDLGARLTGRRPPGGTVKLAEIPRQEDASSLPPYLLQFRLVSSRPAPRLGSGNEEVKIFTSATGEDLLVAWTENDRVRYRESDQGGWSDYRETTITGDITQSRAFDILEQRVHNR